MSVYVVLVNFNGWQDTIECLESLFCSGERDFRVLVSDNGSSDGSLERIAHWAQGGAGSVCSEASPVAALRQPRREREIAVARYGRAEAEAGGDPGENAPLVLVECGANLGFAGGNNVALRYALSRSDCDHVWLLNNDTVVEPKAMGAMVERLRESERAGLCGSTLLHYHDPKRVQALAGGWYCKWLGLALHVGWLTSWQGRADRAKVERRMDYPVGASVMATRGFLDQVGLLSEDYFLYFEELDWVLRAAGRFTLAYAPDSIVYHKVGASVGTSSNPGKKSAVCDFWNARNRIFFTRRWFPEALPTVYLMLLGTLLARIALGRWDRVRMLARLLVEGASAPVAEARRAAG